MEVRSNLLIEVGALLGVKVYAMIAAAYIASGVDLFSNPYPGQHIGLTDEHRSLAVEQGDIHTVCKWFLLWVKDLLPAEHAASFNILCFRKIFVHLNCNRDDPDFDDVREGWEELLTVAIAFVFQKNIVRRFGNKCITCHTEKEASRVDVTPPLAFLNTEVSISDRSVLFSDGERKSGSWLVYMKATRSPHISGLTAISTNIAGWFSHFRFCQECEFDYGKSFRDLLVDRQGSASLSKLISLFVGSDDDVGPSGERLLFEASLPLEACRPNYVAGPSGIDQPWPGSMQTAGGAAGGGGGHVSEPGFGVANNIVRSGPPAHLDSEAAPAEMDLDKFPLCHLRALLTPMGLGDSGGILKVPRHSMLPIFRMRCFLIVCESF